MRKKKNSKKVIKSKKKKTKKVVLNLTPTEKKLLRECKSLLKDNPKVKRKNLDKIKNLEKRLYYIKVWIITESQPLKKLRNFRRRCWRGRGCYHLDHIVAIAHGFLEGIEPEKIGSLDNLRFIPWKKNIRKGFKMTEESHRVLRKLKRKP